MLLAVGGELRLDDRLVVGVLRRFLEVRRVHHVEVVVAGEDDRLAVGRERRPRRATRLLGMVFDQRDFARRHVVLEVERLGARVRAAAALAGAALPSLPALAALPLLRRIERIVIVPLADFEEAVAGLFLVIIVLPVAAAAGLLVGGDRLRLARRNHGIARHLHLELERRVVLDEAHLRERQVLRVVGNARERGQGGGHLRGVEQRRLGLLHRIDEHELASVARVVRVPESIAGLEPPRRHARIEHELGYLLRGPGRGEIVVRRNGGLAGGVLRLLGLDGRRGCNRKDDRAHADRCAQGAVG